MALIKRDRENFWMLNWLDEYMRMKVILMMRYSILTARHPDMTETM